MSTPSGHGSEDAGSPPVDPLVANACAAVTLLAAAWAGPAAVASCQPCARVDEDLVTGTAVLTLIGGLLCRGMEAGGAEGRLVFYATRLGLAVAAAVLGMVVLTAVVPSLARERTVSFPESSMMGDARTVMSAQAAYEYAFGAYGSLECLSEPATCNPGYAGPIFLDARLARATEKASYRRTFHAGAPRPETPGGAPRFESYAYVGVPIRRMPRACSSVCADSTGRVCLRYDGLPMAIRDGRCPPAPECVDPP